MKRTFLLILLCFLTIIALASCGENEQKADLSNDAYLYSYESNGDGTCVVVGIGTLNPDKANGVLTIPEKSPSGDTVVGLNAPNTVIFPKMMLEEDFNAFSSAVKEKKVLSDYQFNKTFLMLFSKITLEGASESQKTELLSKYPLLEKGNLYVLSNDATERELNDCAGYAKSAEYDLTASIANVNKALYEMGKSTYYLYGEVITSVSLPSTLKTVGDGTFANLAHVEEILLPNSVTSIGSDLFVGCSSLSSVSLGAGITSIENGTFKDCKEIAEVELSDGVQYIGDYAFSGCTNLASITIPSSVTYIGAGAFENCTGLTEVNFDGFIKEWANISFLDADSNPIKWTHSLLINGSKVTSVNATDFKKVNSYAFYGCTDLTEIVVENGIKSIGDYAFYGCENVVSCTIGDTVTSIGISAFENCKKLTSIVLPADLLTLRTGTFKGCSALADVTFGSKISSFGAQVFYGCTALKKVILPNSVDVLGSSAFQNCTALTNVTLPKSITILNANAFAGCTAITTFKFLGTEKEWNAVTKDSTWNNGARAFSVSFIA